MITEMVKFKSQSETTDEQILSVLDKMINGLQKNQNGFIDAELVKAMEDNTWRIIYHYESIEQVKTSGEKLRASAIFQQFTKLIEPGSTVVNFYQPLSKY